MNKLDKDYINLLNDILENGTYKETRNGGVFSVFGRQIRHKMSTGFPLLTTKKMAFKTIVTELMWFLHGRTDLKYLLDNNCHIWVGDAYENYKKIASTYKEPDYTVHVDDPNQNCTRLLTKDEFVDRIKTDIWFSNDYGNLGKVYGYQWRNWESYGLIPTSLNIEDGYTSYIPGIKRIDQIQKLIDTLKTNPDDRRMLVSAWNPSQLDEQCLPPCHYSFQVYTRELTLDERRGLVTQEMFNQIYNSGGPESLSDDEINQWNIPTRAISLLWNQRSCDFPLGIPANIMSYGILLSLLGKIVNMIPDELIGNFGDCHIYTNQIDGVKEQIAREPFELPTLRINDEFWLTETQECSVGNLTSNFSNLIKSINIEDFSVENYKSHPKIYFPLSN
jgi:thymidylate synthase